MQQTRPRALALRRLVRRTLGLLLPMLVAACVAQCGDPSGIQLVNADSTVDPGPPQGPVSDGSSGGDSGGGAGGGTGGGTGGGGGGGGGGGTLPSFIGIDSYVYYIVGEGGEGQWPGEYIVLTSQLRQDLQGYEGVRIYLTDFRGGVTNAVSGNDGLWQYRTLWPGGTTIDVTSPEGIPILRGVDFVVLDTGPTTWPTSDITIPTAGVTDSVSVVIESLGDATKGGAGR